jgi:hypothetical protein
MKIRIELEGRSLTATLENSEAARDFLSLLPLTLTLTDYNLAVTAPRRNHRLRGPRGPAQGARVGFDQATVGGSGASRDNAAVRSVSARQRGYLSPPRNHVTHRLPAAEPPPRHADHHSSFCISTSCLKNNSGFVSFLISASV